LNSPSATGKMYSTIGKRENFRNTYTNVCNDLKIEPIYSVLDALAKSLHDRNNILDLSSHNLGNKESFSVNTIN
jgi:hypothetical protein